jgi:hypothetical protein
MSTMTFEEKVNYLADRAEISEVIARYTYGMDSRDWDLYRSAWVDGEIYFEHTDVGFATASTTRHHIDDWIKGLKALIESLDYSQHIKTPVRFEIDGDSATVLCTLQGKHYRASRNGDALLTVVGYYVDDFERTADGWRMRGSRELIYWNEGNSHVIDVGLQEMNEVLNSTR